MNWCLIKVNIKYGNQKHNSWSIKYTFDKYNGINQIGKWTAKCITHCNIMPKVWWHCRNRFKST